MTTFPLSCEQTPAASRVREQPGPGPHASVSALVAEVLGAPAQGRLLHVAQVPARTAGTTCYPGWVPLDVRGRLLAGGVDALWTHQARAAQLLHEGRHVVLATGTASGKSLGYLVPMLSALAAGSGAVRRPTALYLAPTKALAADQAERIARLDVPGVRAATYDGDTPTDERRWIRRHAGLVLTNPDMLHAGVLPAHEAWSDFWRGLRYVVIDECHVYRGVFGAHVAAVLRRLRRVAARYGATPTFALASATIAEPAQHARRLVGLPVEAVEVDASPGEAMTVAFVDPREAEGGPACGAPAGALARSAALLAEFVRRDVQTVVFARSRLGAEVVAARARRILRDEPALAASVAAYRGGYLPEERRDLEARLRDGRLRGLAATSALELGIDISGLDAVVMAGWPGTRSALWQRAGRAGRRGRASLAVLLADDDPLDHYIVTHPQSVLGGGVEACAIDPTNPYVVLPHLAAAAAEVPLTRADEEIFGPGMGELADELVRRGLLRRRRDGWYWTRPERAADLTTLRGAGASVGIVETHSGRVLGTVDVPRADSVVHTGAVYVHQQHSYVVTHLDLDAGTALVAPGDPGWHTQARSVSAFDIDSTLRSHTVGPVTASFGRVTVRSRVTSFLRRAPDGTVLGEQALDLPERRLPTRATWWTLRPEALAAAGVEPLDVPGAAHAAEHAAIGLLPLLATADRWDIGGVSTACHPDTGLPTVMVYDGHAGGAGIAEQGFARRGEWLRSTAAAIATCPCAGGCPSCVQSPKCGNGNEPLDKAGALRLLDLILRHDDP